jgi:hypothetical protein
MVFYRITGASNCRSRWSQDSSIPNDRLALVERKPGQPGRVEEPDGRMSPPLGLGG